MKLINLKFYNYVNYYEKQREKYNIEKIFWPIEYDFI